ncbi:MAG: hypothetical protein LBL39_05755 [Planctomycetaceae bacterium]|jgi:hypothetical protein|nr:hypothetical protein [Planctomycetaceae bacterium]
MKRFEIKIIVTICVVMMFEVGFQFQSILLAQEKHQPTHYTYVRSNESKAGDYKVVVVPAVEPRQARLDAQTYHIGWDAVDAWMGQSRVMFCVLLKKRPPYIRGTPPVPRPIPKNKK